MNNRELIRGKVHFLKDEDFLKKDKNLKVENENYIYEEIEIKEKLKTLSEDIVDFNLYKLTYNKKINKFKYHFIYKISSGELKQMEFDENRVIKEKTRDLILKTKLIEIIEEFEKKYKVEKVSREENIRRRVNKIFEILSE